MRRSAMEHGNTCSLITALEFWCIWEKHEFIKEQQVSSRGKRACLAEINKNESFVVNLLLKISPLSLSSGRFHHIRMFACNRLSNSCVRSSRFRSIFTFFAFVFNTSWPVFLFVSWKRRKWFLNLNFSSQRPPPKK